MDNHKVVLITGATSGFGRATAQLLAQKGYRLILLGRRVEKLQELKEKLGANIYTVQIDVRDRKAVEEMFAKLPPGFSDISILINNAGLARGLETADEAKIEDWEEMIDTNIKGLLYVTKCTLKLMKTANRGLIINIGSVAGAVAYKGGNVYGATKAFVRQFSKNLRADLFGTNIKVTNIEPGMAETEFSLVRFKGDTSKAENVYANTRPLKAEDIAKTINWVIDQPEHVNIDNIEIMPVDQTFAGLVVNRQHAVNQ